MKFDKQVNHKLDARENRLRKRSRPNLETVGALSFTLFAQRLRAP